ncbi:PKD domain-containing protein [uncultured Chitinophaga sp.]|uniref:PKD domain-containing protein n=1 Tax=uncultured Chitinophaga sp. TaxID=339340 RepID=UPI002605DD5A|nr:PKD domain-containing protein [uncultured Chitinophaga sp.]
MILSFKAIPGVAFTYIAFFVPLLQSTTAEAQLKADFTPSKTSDCESLITTFNDNSTGSPVSWQWDLGNGATSTQQSPGASYTSPGTYKVTLTVKDAAGNTSSAEKSVTVWARPQPDFTASPAKGCIPFDVTFTDRSNPVNGTISTYSWDFGDGNTGSGSNPVHTYKNVMSPTVTLTVTNSNGCTASKSISNIVDAGPALVAGFSVSDRFLCTVPGELRITNTSSGPGVLTYQWDFGDGGTATGATPAAHTYTQRGVYKVKLTVTNDRGCTATKTSADINVANFKTDFQLPESICENNSTSFTAANTPKANSLSWSVDKGYIGNGESPDYTPEGAGTVKVTMTANYGTCQETITKDYVVKPAPKASFSTDQQAICDVPVIVQLTDQSQGATSWNWNFGNGQTSAQQHPTATYNSLGNFNIRLTAANASGCTSTAETYVQVQKPEVTIYPALSSVCEGHTASFYGTISDGDTIATYDWDFGDGSPRSTAARPSHIYNNAGVYPVVLNYTTTRGCKGTASTSEPVRIYEKPVPDFSSPEAPQICGNNQVHFNATTNIGQNFSWNFGDGTRGHGQHTTHSYRAPGTYSVTLTVSNNGCTESITKPAYITAVNPFPRFSMQDINCDQRTTISFDEHSPGDISSWKWDWGDGKENTYTSKTTPVRHTYDQTGVYQVKLTVTNGVCTSSDSADINVYAPTPVIITADKTTLCGNEVLTTRVTSIDRSIYDSSYYNWHISDGTPATWDTNNYDVASFVNLRPGNDTIRYIARNHQGCLDSSNNVIVNVHGPIAKFASPDVQECRGTELTFTDQTDITYGKPIKSWTWDFGDGSGAQVFTAPPFKYTYNRSGYFYPSLMVTDEDGCTDSITGSYLQVNGPNADFRPSASLIPPGGNVRFSNLTTETGGDPSYEWDFGDNTTSTGFSPLKNYPDKGIYTVKLLVKDDLGCTDSAKKQIKVSRVSAGFTVTTSFVNNSGCPPVVARFTNTSVNYTSVYWDFGDGSFATIPNPSHTYTYVGKFKVKLKVVGDADTEDEYEQEVEVKGPYATIATSSYGGCLTKEIEFKVSALNAVNYAWDFTDGNVMETTDSTIKHTFKDPGVYRPRLILYDSGGCKGTAFLDSAIVVDKLDVRLDADPAYVCDSGWITFNPTFNSYSIDELQYQATYKWTYEADLPAENETSANPGFYLDKVQAYTFTLSTTTAVGCTQTVSKTVQVYPKPELSITGPLQACQDAPVSFSGTVARVNDVSWKWDFGNGNTSNVQAPADQVYSNTGAAAVVLTASSKDGCSDTAQHNISILPKPVVNAAATPSVICLGNSTTLSAGGGVTYQWSPAEDLDNPQAANPVASPKVNSTYTVSVTDANGCNNTDQVSIRVAQPFTIQATPDTVICLGHVLPLRAWGADHYVWQGPGLDNANSQFPNASIQAPGNFTYQVTGYDADGCFTHDTSLVVDVRPLPTVNAGPDQASMAGVALTLTATGSPDVIKWSWTPAEFLDCANCPTTSALPNLSTQYQVEVENRYGCKAMDEVLVKVTCDKGAVFLPTALTPNRDGRNEWFYPKGRGIKEVSWMRIFDRWGTLVFERSHFQINNANAGWDGSWKNQLAPMGTYVYALETVCEDGTTFLFRGTVTIIK